MSEKESLRIDGIEVVSIMTPPASHQLIAEKIHQEKYSYNFRQTFRR